MWSKAWYVHRDKRQTENGSEDSDVCLWFVRVGLRPTRAVPCRLWPSIPTLRVRSEHGQENPNFLFSAFAHFSHFRLTFIPFATFKFLLFLLKLL